MNQRIMKQKKRKKQAHSPIKKEAKERKILQWENWSSKPRKKKIREDPKTKTHQLGYLKIKNKINR